MILLVARAASAFPSDLAASVEVIGGAQLGFTLDNFDRFGIRAAWLGDLDGDGRPEVAVGAHTDDEPFDSGAAYVFSHDIDPINRALVRAAAAPGAARFPASRELGALPAGDQLALSRGAARLAGNGSAGSRAGSKRVPAIGPIRRAVLVVPAGDRSEASGPPPLHENLMSNRPAAC